MLRYEAPVFGGSRLLDLEGLHIWARESAVRLVQMAFFFHDIPIRMEGPTYVHD